MGLLLWVQPTPWSRSVRTLNSRALGPCGFYPNQIFILRCPKCEKRHNYMFARFTCGCLDYLSFPGKELWMGSHSAYGPATNLLLARNPPNTPLIQSHTAVRQGDPRGPPPVVCSRATTITLTHTRRCSHRGDGVRQWCWLTYSVCYNEAVGQ